MSDTRSTPRADPFVMLIGGKGRAVYLATALSAEIAAGLRLSGNEHAASHSCSEGGACTMLRSDPTLETTM